MAEGDLLLAPTAPALFFVRTLFGLAVAGMPDVVAGFAYVEALTGMLGLTDTPAAIRWLTNVVRARGSVSSTGAPTVGSSVPLTVGSEVSTPTSGLEGAPRSALVPGSSATVVPKEVLSSVVDPSGSSLLDSLAMIPLS